MKAGSVKKGKNGQISGMINKDKTQNAQRNSNQISEIRT